MLTRSIPVTDGWTNWSGRLSAPSARLFKPRDEGELSQVLSASRSVRPVGSGHSFSALALGDDAIVSLDQWQDEGLSVSPDGIADVPAGMKLSVLTRRLRELGWALANQGDIDEQALGGAIATGTHGTGLGLTSLSAMIEGARLILADGSALDVDRQRDSDLFEAVRLSLGALGIVTRLRIRVVPVYRLAETIRTEPLEAVLESFWDRVNAHRHFEFWQFPYSAKAITKTLDLTEEAPRRAGTSGPDEAQIMTAMCEIGRRVGFLSGPLQRLMVSQVPETNRVGWSGRIFPSPRTVRFNEMEYHLPLDTGLDALRACLKAVRLQGIAVCFPFEVRTVGADDVWLSPFNGAPRLSLAVHQYWKQDPGPLMRVCEPILQEAGGRPHWGKMHSLKGAALGAHYPLMERFKSVRACVDPTGKFLSPYLRELLAI